MIVKGLRKYDHATTALSSLNWLPVLKQWRLRYTTMIFKYLNHLAPSYLSHNLSKRSDVHTYRTRFSNDLNLPRCRTVTAQRYFFYHAVKHYSSINPEIKLCKTLEKLKRSLKADLLKWFSF